MVEGLDLYKGETIESFEHKGEWLKISFESGGFLQLRLYGEMTGKLGETNE